MAEHEVVLEVIVTITTTDEGEAGIDRAVGLDAQQAAEIGFRPGLSKQELLIGLARSLIYAGHSDANQDGYADLARDSIEVRIDHVGEM